MSNSPQGSRGRRLFLRSMVLNSASSHVPKIQKCSFGFSRNVRHVDETDDLRSAKLLLPFRDDLFERGRHRDQYETAECGIKQCAEQGQFSCSQLFRH